MSHAKTLVLGILAATLFAAGANAAVTQNNVQSFENQTVQERGYSGLDRHECQNLRKRSLKLPSYCQFGL